MSIFSGIKFNIPEDKREKEAQTGTSLFSGIKFNAPQQEPKPIPKSPMQLYLEKEKQEKEQEAQEKEQTKKTYKKESPLVDMVRKDLSKSYTEKLREQVDFIKNLPAMAKQMFVEYPARLATGAKIQGTGGEYTAQNKFEEFLVGKEPVPELSKQGGETLKAFGAGEETAKNLGLLVGMTELATQAWFPGGKTAAIKMMTKLGKADDVFSFLKKAGVAEDIAKEYAPVIAKAKTEKAVGAAVDAMENLQKQTKAVQATKPAQPLGNLAQEARKYKTAEEITSDIKAIIYEQGLLAHKGKWDEVSKLDKKIEQLTNLRNNFRVKPVNYSDIPLFHGTQSDKFKKFDINHPSSNSLTSMRGAYFFTKKEPAMIEYGKNLVEAKAKIKKPLIIDGDKSDEFWNSLDIQREIEKAEKGLLTNLDDYIISGNVESYDAVIIKNANRGYGYSENFDEIIIPKNKIKNISIADTRTVRDKVPSATATRPIKHVEAPAPAKIEPTTTMQKELANPEKSPIVSELFQPTPDPSKIATRKLPSGKSVLAIRKQSGVYADKGFETQPFKDYGGQSDNLVSWAATADNIQEGKGFGETMKMVNNVYKEVANRNDFLGKTSLPISKLFKENGLYKGAFKELDAKDGRIIFDLMEGKSAQGATAQHKNVANGLRKILDDLHQEANAVRRALNKKEIGYIDNYAPHMAKSNTWREFLSDTARASDNLDFIVPNAPFNPRALKRYGDMMEKEKDIFKLLDGYVKNIADDIYISPVIEKMKANAQVMSGREMEKSANIVNKYIRENLLTKPHAIDNILGMTQGSLPRKLAGKIIQARVIGSLAGNISWILFTQPMSLVNTIMKTGFVNTAKGMTEWFSNPAVRKSIRETATMRLKSQKGGVGTTGGGDLGKVASKIYRGKIEKFNDLLGVVGDTIEYHLTGLSINAGLKAGKNYGLKGKDLQAFGEYVGQVSQSMYNAETRTMLLNSMMVRLGFPFQTFAYEMWRHIKTMTGRGGGLPLSQRQRLGQAINLVIGSLVVNQITNAARGYDLQTAGSFIPLVGQEADKRISQLLTGQSSYGGRSPVAPLEDASKITTAISDFVYKGNFEKLRKELTYWGMGMAGIGGAVQLERMIDAIKEGDLRRIVLPKSSPLLIPAEEKELRNLLKGQNKQRGDEIVFAENLHQQLSSDIAPEEKKKLFANAIKENPNIASRLKDICDKEDKGLTDIERLIQYLGVENGERAKYFVKKLNELKTKEEKRDYYNNILQKGLLTENVAQQMISIVK